MCELWFYQPADCSDWGCSGVGRVSWSTLQSNRLWVLLAKGLRLPPGVACRIIFLLSQTSLSQGPGQHRSRLLLALEVK